MARVSDDAFDVLVRRTADLAGQVPDLEAALRLFNAATQAALGDDDAAARPDALRAGERDYRVAGAFLITPDRRYNMLCGSIGFPAEQRRLMIPIDWNDPGTVVATEAPLLIPNTDEHVRFRQFLKSSRMGSSIYAPVFVDGRMVGQLVGAAQARWSYDESDLDRLVRLASAVAPIWRHHRGDIWLARDYPAPDAWRADARARLDG